MQPPGQVAAAVIQLLISVSTDELADARCDHLAPASAGENPVMPAFRCGVVLLLLLGDAGTQIMSGARLALAGDVVQLAFDRQ